MIPHRDEKIENAILFFASEHHRATKEHIFQTALYKYLAFLDFRSIDETGAPVLGLSYSAMEHGPVPDEIYKEKRYQKTDSYSFTPKGKGIAIIARQGKKPDLSFFSHYEIELMGNLIFFFAQRWVTTSVMSDASHQEIKAWKKAWKNNPSGPAAYEDTFDGDIAEKIKTGTSSIAEEHFALYAAFQNAR